MKPLPGDDIVDEKAFELAVRDPVFRKTRIEELRKKVRTSFRMIWCGIIPGVLFVILNYRTPVTITHFLASFNVFVMTVGPLFHASRFRNEAKILQMLDIQDGIAASQTPTP